MTITTLRRTLRPAQLYDARCMIIACAHSHAALRGTPRGVAPAAAAPTGGPRRHVAAPARSRPLLSLRTPRLAWALTTAAAGASSSSGGSAGAPSVGAVRYASLEDWICSHGGSVNGVELATTLYPSGAVDRQLTATADIPAGTCVISVPLELQLRYDNLPAPDAAAMQRLFERMPRGSDTGAPAWQFKQALALLYHLSRGPASPLAPYLPYLPGLAAGVPTPRVAMLMHPEAVAELQYPPLQQDVANQQYWWDYVSKQVLPFLGQPAQATATSTAPQQQQAAGAAAAVAPAPEDGDLFRGMPIDKELFGWAVGVVMSRSFGLRSSGAHAMPPLIDMANHVPAGAACEIRSTPDGAIAMFTKRQVSAGEALSLTYGSHDSHNLLLSYGFTLQPNPNDAFWMDMDLSTLEDLVEGMYENPSATAAGPGAVLRPWQLVLLGKVGFGGTGNDGSSTSGTAATAAGEVAAADGNGLASSTSGNSGASSAAVAAATNGTADAGAAVPSASSTVRVYFTAPPAGSEGIASAPATDSLASPTSAAPANAPSALLLPPRPPVDPRLLAAVRVSTLPDEWRATLEAKSAAQLGCWPQPLASRQHEITVLRLLAALVTAVYSGYPSTIQQDKQLLASASIDVAAAAAAATLTTKPQGPTNQRDAPPSPPSQPSPSATATPSTSAPSAAGCAGPRASAAGPWLRPRTEDAVACHARDMATALRFRLGMKLLLEASLKALVSRARELDALQQVR